VELAPIVLFVYNRPWHTLQTLTALKSNNLADESTLYIYSDGPKDNASQADIEKIKKVREVIRKHKWCKNVEFIEQDKNLGLATSIIDGITEVINNHYKVIVLEDDLVTSIGFLTFMNEALELYANNVEVMHISGFMFPLQKELPETFFYNAASCWGWATWKRAWDKLETDPVSLKTSLIKNNLINRFLISPNSSFLNQLEKNIEGEMNTWGIKWHASVILNNGLCLHPGKSLVNNIGHDGSGINSSRNSLYHWKALEKHVDAGKIELIENQKIRKLMQYFYDNQQLINRNSSLMSSSFARIKRYLKKISTPWRHKNIFNKYTDFTMIPSSIYRGNLEIAESIIDIPGCVVECGVWKGGMISGITEVLGKVRHYYLFDSFEGLPPAKQIDGLSAIEWQSNIEGKDYFDNCTANISFAKKAMEMSKADEYCILEGWFESTLENFKPNQEIALLRLDGDWYDSTMICLEKLFPFVALGGIIILDDYYTWDGCSRAVHEYLSMSKNQNRIHQHPSGVAYIRKAKNENI
jgi:hypothetical protein